MTRRTKNIAITTGDIDGIGLEVSVKALLKLGPSSKARYFLYRAKESDAAKSWLKKLDSKFKRTPVENLSEAFFFEKTLRSKEKNILYDIHHSKPPPFWVEEAAQECLKARLDGICTAPMSKELIFACGLKDMGHTDILARVSGVKDLRMGFIGDKFNVVLATGHIPLQNVSKALTSESLKKTIRLTQAFHKMLGLSKPIALLGLNPHAGEKGLIGTEEGLTLSLLVRWAQKEGISIEGPLVPDAAFMQGNWKKYGSFVACYHDQGLIPFKMIHGQDSGCHVSLGLPFIRTSVDHGTAKDIFGKNKANPKSMLSALEYCLKLTR